MIEPEDLAAMDQMTLPNGEHVGYSYDTLGQPIGVTSDALTGGGAVDNIVSGVSYTPWGAYSQIKVGFGAQTTTMQYTYALDTLRVSNGSSDLRGV